MQDNYLELASAKDLKNPKDRFIYRSLEILPALLSWGTLIMLFVLSRYKPVFMAVFVIVFDCYWLLKVLYLAAHQSKGYQNMKKNMAINWLAKVKKIKDWQSIYHIVILPMYKEGKVIVHSSLEALVETDYPKDKMIVVLAVEERGGPEALETATLAQAEFAKHFYQFLVIVHPQDIVGELAGKGSNVNWTIKELRKNLLDKLAIPYEKVIVSNFDIDTKPFPQYFSILTWHYLTVDDALNCSYQPIPMYNNNIWQAPAFSRIVSTSGTFWQMMQQGKLEQLVSYSSHSVPFKVLVEVGFPHNIVSDDSRIFWKAYLTYDGKYRVVPLYYPVSMDAVLAEKVYKTAINQYKQQRRWGWGCENIPYLLYGFMQNKKIPFKKKVHRTFVMLSGFWSWAVAALLIFFLGWLPLMLGGEEFKTTLLSYNLPRTTSTIMTISMVGLVISAAFSMLLLPPRPKEQSRWKGIFMLLQWVLTPVTLILFGAFPALEAQLRLAIGKRLGFWVTEKVRK